MKWKKCCFPQTKSKGNFKKIDKRIIIKTNEEICKIKEVCKITSNLLKDLIGSVRPGMTTNDLEEISIKLHKELNVVAAPLGYGNPPYQATICTSVNSIICHGKPNNTILKKGDILNIDVSCIKDGFFGDCSDMVVVGGKEEASQDDKKLINTVSESLNAAIKICGPGVDFRKIGDAINEVCKSNNCSIVEEFVGHGIGIKFHEYPNILHHKNSSDWGVMTPGMIFTIEPIINFGKKDVFCSSRDGWEYKTSDGKNSAQIEHAILITDKGYEILTIPD